LSEAGALEFLGGLVWFDVGMRLKAGNFAYRMDVECADEILTWRE